MPKIETSMAASPAISKLDFLKRLSFAERVAIETAAETSAEIRVVKESLQLSEEIRLDDPEMIAGLELYVAKALITEERKDAILG